MALLELFDCSLLGRRDTAALQWAAPEGGLTEFTFGELESRSNQVARVLHERGLRIGDRLAILLANSVDYIDLWLASVKLGVVAVPINVLYRAREITHIVGDAEPAVVVTTAERPADLPSGSVLWDVRELQARARSMNTQREAPSLDADAPAAIIYTSGTTGVSKGAVLTQGNLAVNAEALVGCWGITDRDRYLACLPLFHVHGLANGLHCWLLSGCHMRLVERFHQDRAAAWFEDYQPTLFFGVPTMYTRLLDLPADATRRIGARLRLAVSGSAPLPAPVLERFQELYGHVILERYGMTETLMNASNPLVGERRAGSVGRPLPHVSIRILDDAGQPVPEGESGELWVRGPNVCAGYWRRPDATAATFRDGWFRTGDFGRRGANGYITLEGRRGDLIISGGFNIYPREIEELLSELPGVREAVVVGAPDPIRGEVPIAYVATDGPFDESAARARLGETLASFKHPRGYVPMDCLPRNAMGKVQKQLLPPWQAP